MCDAGRGTRAASNLRDQNYSTSGYQRFTHDAWNRMVSCQLAGTPLPQQPVQLENEYNGLHWRTISRVPADSMSEEPGGSIREMYYSAAWQLIEERIDEDYVANPGTNRTTQEVWGLRYIDDAVMRTAEVGAEDPRRFYHLTDVQFSTVAMVGLGGTYAPLYERVSYDPYGRATHRWAGDVNNDGAVNSTDVGLVTTAAAANSGAGYAMGTTGYDVRMDLNRDGLVNDDDEDLFVALPAQAALAGGEISDRSSVGPDNLFGYDGYVFAPELSRYCVRYRWYDPVTGRWMERDPAGSINGMNLFEYAMTSPIIYTDPSGRDVLDWIPIIRTIKKGMESVLGTSADDYVECGLKATPNKCQEDAILAEDACNKCIQALALQRLGKYLGVDIPKDVGEAIFGAAITAGSKKLGMKIITQLLGGVVAADGIVNLGFDLATIRKIQKASEAAKKANCDCTQKVCRTN